MKLLVSNYIGTIKPYYGNNPSILEKQEFNKNLKKIKKFIEDGNKFMISTLNDFSNINKEISSYKIIYDYLSILNGRVILDKNNQVIYANYIDEKVLMELDKISYLIRKIDFYNEYQKTSNIENIVSLNINIEKDKKIIEFIKEIRDKYPDVKIEYNNLMHILKIKNKSNKSLAIKQLIKCENLPITKEDIITVGSGEKDFEMIKNYNGYRLSNSNYKLMSINNITTSVQKLIKKI